MTMSHRGAFEESAVTDILFTDGPQFNTTSSSNFTALANQLTPGPTGGAGFVFLQCTANGANAVTTRTAAQMVADIQAAMGVQNITNFTFVLRIINTGNNTVTLTAGTGVTLTGTATVANNTTRDWLVTVNSPTTMTFQTVGVGTIS